MSRLANKVVIVVALVLVGAPIVGIAGPSQVQNAGPSQVQKALKIVMVPKFTGAAYFAATEKGAKEAVAELKGKGVAIDVLYTGPSVANTDEEIRMIDDLVAQKPDAIIIAANNAEAMVPGERAQHAHESSFIGKSVVAEEPVDELGPGDVLGRDIGCPLIRKPVAARAVGQVGPGPPQGLSPQEHSSIRSLRWTGQMETARKSQ